MSTIQPLTVYRFPQSVVAFLVPVRLRQYKNTAVSLVSQSMDSKRNVGVWTPGSRLSGRDRSEQVAASPRAAHCQRFEYKEVPRFSSTE